MKDFNIKAVDGLTFNGSDHRYELDGKWIPGVTTITGNMSKPYLVPWAAKMVMEKAKELIKPNTPYTEKELAALLLTAKQAPDKRKTGAADKGKLAHGWIEGYIKGENLIDAKPTDPDVCASVDSFLAWERENKPRWIQSELLVCSRKYEYAGTLDAVAEIAGRVGIVDFKSGKSIPDDISLQVDGGYRIAVEEMGGEIDFGAVLHIPALPGSKYEYRELTAPVEFAKETFLSLRQIAKWSSYIKSSKKEIR